MRNLLSDTAFLNIQIFSLLLVVGILPGLFGLTAIYNQSKKELISSKGLYFKEVALYANTQAKASLQEKVEQIEKLALSQSIRNFLGSATSSGASDHKPKELPSIALSGGKEEIIIYDNSMKPVAASAAFPPSGNERVLEKVAKSGKKFISGARLSANKNHFHMEVYAPIAGSAGETIGIICVLHDIGGLFSALKNAKLGEMGYTDLVIFRDNRTIWPITSTTTESGRKEQIGITGRESGWSLVTQKVSGRYGGESIIGYSPLSFARSDIHHDSFEGQEWFILTSQAPEETFKPINDFRKTVFWYSSLFVLLVLLIGHLAFRRIIKVQKFHQTEVVYREKIESVKHLLESFQEMMVSPLEEFSSIISEMDHNSGNNGEAIKKTRKIQKNLLDMKNLIEHLKYYTKTHSVEMKPVNLLETVNLALGLLDYLISRKRITVHLNMESEDKIILPGEPKLLSIVILNVILNAVHAIENGNGEIKIVLKSNETWATCIIHDNGRGIPEDEIEHVFDPFFTTKKGRKNYGLGLPISRGIIEKHGGNIAIKSNRHSGTQVSIRLKLASEAPAQ